MFDKILIANRGEIACRVMKTAKKMGIRTVAVFSEADASSLHVKLADEAYCIGEAKASESYLNIENIINAALKTQAQAIHPGYGFLSENVLFAKACMDAGIVFIGPDIKALEVMGSKQTARKMMADKDIPLTPGYHGANQDDNHLLNEAKKIGFPVLLKAAAGGGGKGMRAVFLEHEFIEQLHGARREARSSFADETMIIEKLVQKPRHVEVQIMADRHDHVLHLFERDCSIQRRHQKIIEEAPAPNIKPETRKKMHQAACQVAKSIDYLGAGTVEFLFDEQNNQFYFMEMNTRLQVEHPVTEMITGIDLVELQIIVAYGDPLPITQEDIKVNGHAVECRVYAEDPANHFLPSTGCITSLKLPEINGVRIDSGIEKLSNISRYYDPMIAKIIAHGKTRENAISKLQMALEGYQLTGVKTNIAFVHQVLSQEAFKKTKLNTHFLDDHPYSLADKPTDTILCAAIALSQPQDVLPEDFYGFALHEPQSWFIRLTLDEHDYPVFASMPKPMHYNINYREKMVECQIDTCFLDKQSGTMNIMINNSVQHTDFYIDNDQFHLFIKAQHFIVKKHQYITNDDTKNTPSGLTAPMPSSVVSVLKNIGDMVKKGDRLLILEAMKMEHSIHAPFDGLIEEIFFIAGQQVQEGAQLIRISKDLIIETKCDEG